MIKSSIFIDIHTHNANLEPDVITPSSYGVHPWCAGVQEVEESMFCDVECVGEVGLDKCCEVEVEVQLRVFEQHLFIAQKLDKVVVIHCVRCYNEVLSILARYRLRGVIFHGFIGPKQLMQQILKAGYYISFGERLLRSPKSQEALRYAPLDRIFLESDDAGISVKIIYSEVAQILDVDVEKLQETLYDNYKKLFLR